MDPILLDTDVFSFLFKRDTRAKLYELDIIGHQLCLSFQSVAELRYWAMVRKWGPERVERLEEVMHGYTVLPFDNLVCTHWAEITGARRALGNPIECGDAWIAATAIRHGIALAIHNARHYEKVPGLKVVSHP